MYVSANEKAVSLNVHRYNKEAGEVVQDIYTNNCVPSTNKIAITEINVPPGSVPSDNRYVAAEWTHGGALQVESI
jgi:hypothetical protein